MPGLQFDETFSTYSRLFVIKPLPKKSLGKGSFKCAEGSKAFNGKVNVEATDNSMWFGGRK